MFFSVTTLRRLISYIFSCGLLLILCSACHRNRVKIAIPLNSTLSRLALVKKASNLKLYEDTWKLFFLGYRPASATFFILFFFLFVYSIGLSTLKSVRCCYPTTSPWIFCPIYPNFHYFIHFLVPLLTTNRKQHES